MGGITYSFRRGAFRPERHFSLEADRLEWSGPSKGSVAYRDIEEVRTYKVRFWGSSKGYWSCLLRPRKGRAIALSAAHRKGLRSIEDRDVAYIPFIKDLEARIKAANPQARFGGYRPWLSRVETAAGWIAVGFVRALRRLDRERASNAMAWFMRKLGPWLRGHRTARAQLMAAMPEKSVDEVHRILAGMWDNLGRVMVEYAHLDHIWDFDPARPSAGRIELEETTRLRFREFVTVKGPILTFSAHLANWEVPALGCTAHGRDIALVYRAPTIGPLSEEIVRIRTRGVAAVIPAGPRTVLQVRDVLKRGHVVGMLVDQHYAGGCDVTFFGRRCKVNTMVARFARLYECPIYGCRVVRKPGGRFRYDLTERLTPPRDADGKVDVEGTMQMITSIIEGWVREYPEQWMWLHKRWR